MAWSMRIIAGLALAAAAGASLAGERPCDCRGPYEVQDRYGPPHAWRQEQDAYAYEHGAYEHGAYEHGAYEHGVYEHHAYREAYGWREPVAPCSSACGGELTLPSSFFGGAGGVGPIPTGPIYGGGYVYVGGGGFSGARAFATSSASASASASVSVRFSGGGRSGGCCH